MIVQINVAITAVITSLGFSLNALAIWMILRHTQSEMRSYSRILLQTCVTDLLTIGINFFVQPVFFTDNGAGSIWSYGPAHLLPNPWQEYCFRLFAFMTRFTSTGICSLFIYRYFLVNRDIQMSLKGYFALITLVATPSLVLLVCSLFSNSPTPENEHLTNRVFIELLELDNATVENTVVAMRSGANPLSIFVPRFAMAHTICSYALVVVCGLAVQLHIRSKYRGPSMAAKRKINRQISVLLLIQAILPSIGFLPQLLVNAMIIFNVSSAAGSLLLTCIGFFSPGLVVFIAVLNPLVTLLSISAYRRALLKWPLGCWQQAENVAAVTTVSKIHHLPSPLNDVQLSTTFNLQKGSCVVDSRKPPMVAIP